MRLKRIICGFNGHKSKRIAVVDGYEIFECSRCGELIAIENQDALMNRVLNELPAAPYIKDRVRRNIGLENNCRD
jgi:hypothetical protein